MGGLNWGIFLKTITRKLWEWDNRFAKWWMVSGKIESNPISLSPCSSTHLLLSCLLTARIWRFLLLLLLLLVDLCHSDAVLLLVGLEDDLGLLLSVLALQCLKFFSKNNCFMDSWKFKNFILLTNRPESVPGPSCPVGLPNPVECHCRPQPAPPLFPVKKLIAGDDAAVVDADDGGDDDELLKLINQKQIIK